MPLATPRVDALFTVAPAIALLALAGVVVAEAVLLPGMVLPGGTGVVLAGALAGSGRAPVAVVAAIMSVAVLAGDHAAYSAGGRLIRCWRRRGGRPERSEPATGRWRDWALAALPSLAGAQHQPYRRFLPRLIVLRTAWFTGFFTAGVLAARSLGALERVGGRVGIVASALVLAGLLAAHSRGRWRWLEQRNSLQLTALLVLVIAAAWVCGGVLQYAAAHEELARLDPQMAALLQRHVPERVARSAVVAARLARVPGLFFVTAMVIALASLARHGRSTARFAVAASGAGLLAAAADLVLPSTGSHHPAHLGTAIFSALWLTWIRFAWRWLPHRQALLTITITGAGVLGLALAVVLTATATTSVVAGATMGIAWSAVIEVLVGLPAPRIQSLLGDRAEYKSAAHAPQRVLTALLPSL